MSSHSSPVLGPWVQPSTAARASSIDESGAGAEWDGRAGYEHTPAPAILHQASSARSPITLPRSPTASPLPSRLPSFPFLGAHTQNMLGVTRIGFERGDDGAPAGDQQRLPPAGAQQAEGAQQPEQSAGEQQASLGAVHTPPARAQAGEEPVRMLPATALTAHRFSVDTNFRGLRQELNERDRQQAEKDQRTDREFARLAEVRAHTCTDAHLSSLLLEAFLSLDAHCAQQALGHPASSALPKHVQEFCTDLVQHTLPPFPELTEQENAAVQQMLTRLQADLGATRTELEMQLRPFVVPRIHELRAQVQQLQLALQQHQPGLSALTPQLVHQIVRDVSDQQLGAIMDGLTPLGESLLRGPQAHTQQDEGDEEPTPADLEALARAEARVQQMQLRAYVWVGAGTASSTQNA